LPTEAALVVLGAEVGEAVAVFMLGFLSVHSADLMLTNAKQAPIPEPSGIHKGKEPMSD
jgi:hypothetical protein